MKNRLNKGFTLIELLVVITIIAILASISVPVYSNITEKAKVAKTISNTKQIVLACRLFATDWDGALPDGQIISAGTLANSDEAWQELYDSGVLQSPLYWTPGARACSTTQPVLTSSGDIDDEANYFSYTRGMLDSDNGLFPVIWETADTSATASGAVWLKANGHPWRRAFVAGYLDGSAQSVNLNATTGAAVGTTGTAWYSAMDQTSSAGYGGYPDAADRLAPSNIGS